MSVGSPPCQAIVTVGVWCDSSSCLMYSSSRSSAIRNVEPGYSASLDRKKQYVQSRLHTAPVGLARRWKPRRRGRWTELGQHRARTARSASGSQRA